MANPNFVATMSSNEIWRDLDDTRCITDDLDTIESDILELEQNKADANHTHSGYAPSTHGHSYNDLSDKPTIPPAYTHPETHSADIITGLADVATTGNYDDLNGKPTIPVVPFIEDTTYPGCYYHTVNGVTEWVNPPMIVGNEYRTTERWNGKPVYRKTITFKSSGAISGDFNVPNGISNLDVVISCFATVNRRDVLPYMSGNYITRVKSVTSGNIEMGNNNPYFNQNYTWYFQLAYTKED